MKNVLIKSGVLTALALVLLYTGGLWFYLAAITALIMVNFGRLREKFGATLISISAAVVFMLVVMNSFGLYAKGHIIFGYIFFVIAAVSMTVLFYFANNAKEQPPAPALKQQKTGIFTIKTASAILLGVMAWYLLKYHHPLLSALVYAACFVQLLFILPYEKNTAVAVPAAPAPAQDGQYKADLNTLFTMVMLVIIAYKMFMSFTASNYREPLLLFVLAVMFCGVLFSYGKEPLWESAGPDEKDLTLFDWAMVVGLFAVALFIRTRMLKMPGSAADDPLIIQAVMRDCLNVKSMSVFDADNLLLGTVLPIWIVKNFMIFTGGKVTLVTARLVSAVAGSLGVAFIYLLALELFKRRVAVITGLILCTLFIHVLYSRQTIITVIEATMLPTLAFYFFMKGIRKGGAINWISAGIALGFGLYTYHPVKIVPIILVLYVAALVLMAADKKSELSRLFPGLLLTGVASAIVFFPLLEYAAQYPATYFQRLAYASLFKQFPTIQQFVESMVPQVMTTCQLLFCNNVLDYTGTFCIPGKAVLNGPVTFWFLTGLAGVVFLWKRRTSLLLLMWIAIGVLPELFSWHYNGGSIRSVLIIPAIIIITGLGIELVISALEKSLGKPMKAVSPLVTGTILLFVCYTNLYSYFVAYMNHPDVKVRWYTGMERMAENLSKFKNTNVFNSLYFSQQKCVFFTPIMNNSGIDSSNIDISRIGFDVLYNSDGKNAAIVAESLNEKNLLIYKEYFPDAQLSTYYNYEYWLYTNPTKEYAHIYGWKFPAREIDQYNITEKQVLSYDTDPYSKPYINYAMCYIPYEDIKNLYGFAASFYKNATITAQDACDGNLKFPETGCEKAVLKGLFDAKVNGTYAFDVTPTASVEVYLDGTACNPGKVPMIRGLNRIKIVISGIKSKELTLKVKSPRDAALRIVNFKEVIRSNKIFGLTCRASCEGKTFTSRYYTLRQKYYNWWDTANPAEPCNVISRDWKGFITVDTDDYYTIMFKSPYPATVTVDGIRIYESDGKKENAREVRLAKGRHSILVAEKDHQIYYEQSVKLQMKKRSEKEPSEVTYKQLSFE